MARQRYGEARLILPDTGTPHGDTARLDAETALVSAFGGFTRTQGEGAWYDGRQVWRERVYVYDIAVPLLSGTGEDAAREWAGAMTALRAIAKTAAREMQQECIYLRAPTGRVHLIRPDGRDYNPDVEPHPYPRAR